MKVANRFFSKIFLVVLIGISTVIQFAIAQDTEFSLVSKSLDETRNITVYLPESYDPKSNKGYPVIYMLDAGNDDEQTALTVQSFYKEKMMPEVIVVAVHNIRRGFDFTPPYYSFGPKDNRTMGNGDKFHEFFKAELIPYVNKTFNTNQHRIFMGHSWGGVFVSYVLSQSPDMFDAFFLYSPALLFDTTDRIFNELEATFQKDFDFPKFVYVSVGVAEQEIFQNSYKKLTDLLKDKKPENIELMSEKNPDVDHMGNPGVSIPKALKYYFGKYNK